MRHVRGRQPRHAAAIMFANKQSFCILGEANARARSRRLDLQADHSVSLSLCLSVSLSLCPSVSLSASNQYLRRGIDV